MNLPTFNRIESSLGLIPTKVDFLAEEGNQQVFLSQADELWVRNPLFISIYSFLLRILCRPLDLQAIVDAELPLDELVQQVAKQSGKDAGYAKNVVVKMLSLTTLLAKRKVLLDLNLNIGDEKQDQTGGKVSLNTIHYHSGLQSFANDYDLLNKGKPMVSLTKSWVKAYVDATTG